MTMFNAEGSGLTEMIRRSLPLEIKFWVFSGKTTVLFILRFETTKQIFTLKNNNECMKSLLENDLHS